MPAIHLNGMQSAAVDLIGQPKKPAESCEKVSLSKDKIDQKSK